MDSKNNKVIAAVLAVIIGVGAFFGGTIFEKNKLAKQGLLRSENMAGSGGQRRGTGQGGAPGMSALNRGGGSSGAMGDFAAGDIIAKDDKSITIKDRNGGSKIIFFSDATTVGKSVSGSAGDLVSGQQVMASGKTNADGTLSADNIQIRPDQ